MKKEQLAFKLQDSVYRIQRRISSDGVERIYREIVGSFDQNAFRERFQKYWNPFPTSRPAKFLDLDMWLREAIYRYSLWSGLQDMNRGLRVLDIGAGTGYFLLVCRHLGHDVLGLDIEGEPLYDDAFDFFGLPRLMHRIEPMNPIVSLPGRFDIITAFMTTFNINADGTPWGADAWSFFLADLRTRLSEKGRVIIQFNTNKLTQELYSNDVERAIKTAPGFKARLARDFAFLDVSTPHRAY